MPTSSVTPMPPSSPPSAASTVLRKGNQKEPISQFERVWGDYRQIRDVSILPASRAGKTAEATELALGEGSKRFEAVDVAIDALIAEHGGAPGT